MAAAAAGQALAASLPAPTLRLLGAGQHWGYGTLTFPTLRALLGRVGDADVVAVACDDAAGNPAGLALGRIAADADTAELLSIYVVPARRGAGLAGRLLEAFSARCRAQGAREVGATYMTGQASTPAVEALLARAGWSPPEPRMLVLEATLASIARAPWIRRLPLPAGMRIVPWLELTAARRQALVDAQARTAWIPADLIPFDHEADCEPLTSLALLDADAVVGWTIHHRIESILRYTCAYVHPRLQRRCRILLLYNEAVARMPQAGFDTGMWTVPVWHPGHAAFARRWMAPYATRFAETRASRRPL